MQIILQSFFRLLMSTFITFCLAIYKAVYVCVFVHVWRNGQFLPRDVMRISAVLDVGRCLSVCPSVTFVNCIQSATDTVKLLSHHVGHGSPI